MAKVYFNDPQRLTQLIGANISVIVAGRRTGKTDSIASPFVLRNMQRMPGSTGGIVVPTFKHGLTNTIPGLLAAWRRWGYKDGIHYVVGKKPPKSFKAAITEPVEYEHVISFYNGSRAIIISQDRPGSSNSLTLSWLLIDEAKFIDYEKLKDETLPANGGIKSYFGKHSFNHAVMILSDMQKEQAKQHGGMVWFSLNGLIEKMYGAQYVNNLEMQKRLEYALLFLHLIGSITLDHGLVVFYTGLVMDVNPEARSRKFTDKEFQLLDAHYRHKAEAIHIVGEYARLMMENESVAQQLLDDYFTMDLDSFRLKYMFGEAKGDAVSDELRAKIEKVNDEQRKVIRSKRKHILIGAGPGSGKTHLLVHKVASLLWIEEAKPDAILCLTYTRAACRELKKRLFDLAGPLAPKVNITTFHSLAFSILGVQGNKKDLEKNKEGEAEDIVSKAAELLESGDDAGVGAPAVILVDEFQDLSAGEYRLLRALYDLGEKDPRVIVVGDDDQSIFAFRGSSSEYFQKFAEEFPGTEKFFLTTNYRTVSKIIRANESLLGLMTERVKDGSRQQAIKQSGGDLAFYEESNKAYAAFAAAELLSAKFKSAPQETYCILTRENAEAFLAAAKLEEKSIGYKLLKGRDKDKCSIDNTREILGFKKLLEEDPRVGHRAWSAAEFKQIAEQYKKEHAKESSFELLNAVVADFIEAENACGDDEITLGSFAQYLREVSYSDFGQKFVGSVSIGTMHSAKGLEWDHVILALGSWVLKDADAAKAQENYRLLYVAATRAKKTLTVIGDEKMLPHEWLSHFANRGKITGINLPKVLHMETGLDDIVLDLYRKVNGFSVSYVDPRQSILRKTCLGNEFLIEQNPKTSFYNVTNGKMDVIWFSKKFRESVIDNLLKKGYKPISAKLVQLCQQTYDDNQKGWVPLVRVKFQEVK